MDIAAHVGLAAFFSGSGFLEVKGNNLILIDVLVANELLSIEGVLVGYFLSYGESRLDRWH